MKCFTINKSWLEKFNIWSAEFYSLLDKEEYEEILNLSVKEIKKEINNLNLSKEELFNMRENLRNEKDIFRWLVFPLINEKDIYRNYVLIIAGIRLYKNILEKEKENLLNKINENNILITKIKIIKTLK